MMNRERVTDHPPRAIHHAPPTRRHGPGIIAIDGPAASGKSTVGHGVAERLNYLFFDTGLMYRVVTRLALERGMDLHDREAVGALAEELDIALLPPKPEQSNGRYATVLVDGQDVTDTLRTPEVDRNVSVVAANPRVRAALSQHQRRIGQQYASGHAGKEGIVMVGRDIGTVVLPEAPLKIYLDAPLEERARRRHRELLQQGKEAPFDRVLADMQRRDAIDSQRDVAPLRVAQDAQVVQTAGLTVDQVVAHILALCAGDGAVKQRDGEATRRQAPSTTDRAPRTTSGGSPCRNQS